MFPVVRPLVALSLVLAAALLAGCAAPAPSPTPTVPDDLDVHAFPELEARLPNEVGGLTLSKTSVAPQPGEEESVTLQVLRRLGRSPADMQLAVAVGGTSIQISALRVVDSDGAHIAAAFREIEQASPENVASYAGVELAGRSVVSRVTPSQTSYIYAVEDIMFVLSGEQDLVEDALSELP